MLGVTQCSSQIELKKIWDGKLRRHLKKRSETAN